MECDFERRWPYFLRVAASVGVPECWQEDCAQEIALAVWRAGPKDPFSQVVRSEAIDFMRSGLHVRGYNRAHGGRRCPSDHVPEPASLDVLVDAGLAYRSSQFEDLAVERLDLEASWPLLRSRERLALLLYGMGFRWWEVGKLLGVSESRVCQIGQGGRRILLARRAGSGGRP